MGTGNNEEREGEREGGCDSTLHCSGSLYNTVQEKSVCIPVMVWVLVVICPYMVVLCPYMVVPVSNLFSITN